jgi:hypothetical protein
MNTVTLELEEPLVTLLGKSNKAITQVAKEMIVFELYRRGSISSGEAAKLLGIPWEEFIQNIAQATNGEASFAVPLLSSPAPTEELIMLSKQRFPPETKAERVAKALAALGQEGYSQLPLEDLKRIAEDPDLEDQF